MLTHIKSLSLSARNHEQTWEQEIEGEHAQIRQQAYTNTSNGYGTTEFQKTLYTQAHSYLNFHNRHLKYVSTPQ